MLSHTINTRRMRSKLNENIILKEIPSDFFPVLSQFWYHPLPFEEKVFFICFLGSSLHPSPSPPVRGIMEISEWWR
jgi:hypothetical protein